MSTFSSFQNRDMNQTDFQVHFDATLKNSDATVKWNFRHGIFAIVDKLRKSVLERIQVHQSLKFKW